MAGQADSEDTQEVTVTRKTAAQKDNNHMLRQQQIISYKTAMSKEARAQRSRLRRGELVGCSDIGSPESESGSCSPKKRKTVNFNLRLGDDGKRGESRSAARKLDAKGTQ